MECPRKQMWRNKEAELIKLWQQRECLYDFGSKDYHDRSKKQQAWLEISEELQIPIYEIITRTASLRTQYGKLIRPKTTGSAKKTLTARQKWIMKHMEFLKCHVLPRASLSTMEFGLLDCETTGDDEHEQEEHEWTEDMDSFTSDHNIEREKVSLLKHIIDKTIRNEDSDDIFGKLVANKLRQITDPVRKLHVEQSIMNILYAALNVSMPIQNGNIKEE